MALQSTLPDVSGFNAAVRDAWLSANAMSLFTQRSPILKKFEQNGSIQRAGYGTQMREMLIVPVTTGPQLQGVSTGYSPIAPQPDTGFNSAIYTLSEYAINVSWDKYDDVRAHGPVEMVRWRESHFKNALDRSYNKILQDFWAPPENTLSAGDRTQIASIRTFLNGGTTTATDGGAQPPAQASQSVTPVVATSGATAVTTVGTIPRNAAGAAYWCTPLLGTGGAQALTMLVLNSIYEEAWQDSESPDLIITTPDMMSKLQNILTVGGTSGGQRFGESKLAQAGFNAFRFRDTEIVADRRCPTSGFLSGTSTSVAQSMYCVNMRHIKLLMRSRKPEFTEVTSNPLIQQHVGIMYLAMTADHLGNVHSVHCNLTQ